MFEELCSNTEDFPETLPSEDGERVLIEMAHARRRYLTKRRKLLKLQVRHAIDDRIKRDKESHEHRHEESVELWLGRTEALRREELEANQHLIEDDFTPEGKELQPHITEETWARWEAYRWPLDIWVREAMESSRPTPTGDLQRWAEPLREGQAYERVSNRGARRRGREEFEAGNEREARGIARRRNPIMGRVIDLEEESDPEQQD